MGCTANRLAVKGSHHRQTDGRTDGRTNERTDARGILHLLVPLYRTFTRRVAAGAIGGGKQYLSIYPSIDGRCDAQMTPKTFVGKIFEKIDGWMDGWIAGMVRIDGSNRRAAAVGVGVHVRSTVARSIKVRSCRRATPLGR